MNSDAITAGFDFGDGPLDSSIGPYKLVRQIGEGGMGVVYHAQQTQPIRRDVALKIIKPGMDSKQVIARFEAERQALALMDHPNIARVFDAGATPGGLPYFVMELVNGSPITQYCDSKRLSLRQRVELFIPVCQAIQHAHQKGIIHRDIKPSNILVAELEGKPIPKVIDFGLAKALGPQLSDATMMTNFGAVVGTLDYMSPEQAELTKQDVDTRSDVYSLGAVLYELLTATTPLKRAPNTTYLEFLQRARDEEPERPSSRSRHSPTLLETAAKRQSDPARLPKLLSGELDWITMKALEKERSRRYETANLLTHDLQRYLEGEPVEAGPGSASYRLSKIMRKHRLGLSVAAAFLVLLLAGITTTSWMAIRVSRAEQEARAVNDFLRTDLLAQASPNDQAAPNNRPDPDLKVRTALDRAAARIEGKFQKQPTVEAAIRDTIAGAYSDLGLYPEAERLLDRVLQLRRQWLGERDPDTLSSMRNLGDVYTYQGKYAQAESIMTAAVELHRRVFGEKDANTVSATEVLARAYSGHGKYAEAEPLFVRVLEQRRHLYGEEHKTTLLTMNNLARLFDREGKYSQAEPLFTKALENWRHELGEDHPWTMTVKNNLALVYDHLGRYPQAEQLHTEVVEFSRRVLGNDHPNTITSIGSLGMLYRFQGKYPEAESLLLEGLRIGRRVQGEENPNTLLTKFKLADLYRDQHKYVEAAALYSAVAESRKRVLGEENPDTLNTLVSLARVRLLQQEYTDAETTLRQILKVYENVSPGVWQRYSSQSMLGASLAGQRNYEGAESLLIAGYQGLIQQHATIAAENRSDIESAANRIPDLYTAWAKPAKAAEWRQKLQAAR